MKKIVTMDGSETLYNEEYEDHYHSKSGAVEESFEKFVKPAITDKTLSKGFIRILDIGFGLGYNAIAAIDYIQDNNKNCEIELISLEKDLKLDELKSLNPKLRNYNIIQKISFDPITNSYLFEEKNVRLQVKIGEATEIIKKIKLEFDAIFLDGFSPKKNPELWTRSFFSELYRVIRVGGILTTYSYSREIRDNLSSVGFIVKDGPIVGRRSPSTVAIKEKNS